MAKDDVRIALHRQMVALAVEDAVECDGHGLAGEVVAEHEVGPLALRHNCRHEKVVAAAGSVAAAHARRMPEEAHVRARVAHVEMQAGVGQVHGVANQAVVVLEVRLRGAVSAALGQAMRGRTLTHSATVNDAFWSPVVCEQVRWST